MLFCLWYRERENTPHAQLQSAGILTNKRQQRHNFHPCKISKPMIGLYLHGMHEYANSISLGGAISGAHIAPASSVWSQLCTPTALARQSSSSASVPVHAVLSTKIGPLP